MRKLRSNYLSDLSLASAAVLPMLAIVALVSIVPEAHASTRDEQTRACKSDALKFCAMDIPGGEGKITECMQKNMSQLSPGCRAMFK